MGIAALDVGSKRIGVAIADPSLTFALPVAVVERKNVRDDCRKIAAVLAEYSAEEVVIGDPLTLGGTRGPASETVDRFVAEFAKAYDGRIHRVDERFTTAQATKGLIAQDVSRSRRRTAVDKMAAALILDIFLARRRNTGSP